MFRVSFKSANNPPNKRVEWYIETLCAIWNQNLGDYFLRGKNVLFDLLKLIDDFEWYLD